MLTLSALYDTITTGGVTYPIFVAFSRPNDILKVCSVPNFTPHTAHSQIAENICASPVKEWQRPLDNDRIQQVKAVFDVAGELMPNGILLCENPLAPKQYRVSQKKTVGGQDTGVYEVTIDEPTPQESRPLWILDGQHRINGLALSQQAGSPVPTVLLLNWEHEAYAPAQIAKIFAQVTTEAVALEELHKEWLTYAFRLETYDPAKGSTPQHVDSMEAVVELCRQQCLPCGSGTANPFFNNIKFNDRFPSKPAIGPGPRAHGFNYDATRLKNLVYNAYYRKASTVNHLTPTHLAAEIAAAYTALVSLVTNPHQSVFFGNPKKTYQQEIMQDAFLVGVFYALLNNPTPLNWTAWLTNLKFHKTNWDFSWARKHLGGTSGSNSKRVAYTVFGEAFKSGQVPLGCADLFECLQGINAELKVAMSRLTAKNGARGKGRLVLAFNHLASQSVTISPAKHIRVDKTAGRTCNIGKISVLDTASPTAAPKYFNPKKLILGVHTTANPITLEYRLPHYGPCYSKVTITIVW